MFTHCISQITFKKNYTFCYHKSNKLLFISSVIFISLLEFIVLTAIKMIYNDFTICGWYPCTYTNTSYKWTFKNSKIITLDGCPRLILLLLRSLQVLIFAVNHIVSLINILKTLENNLGCFPFDYRPYHLKSDYYFFVLFIEFNCSAVIAATLP